MKLNQVQVQPGDPGEEQYLVEEISADDIAPPTKRFLNLVRDMHGLSFVNFLTVGEFTAQVRNRFVSHKP